MANRNDETWAWFLMGMMAHGIDGWFDCWLMADSYDSEMLRGFCNRLTDWQTDICDSRVTFATENRAFRNEQSAKLQFKHSYFHIICFKISIYILIIYNHTAVNYNFPVSSSYQCQQLNSLSEGDLITIYYCVNLTQFYEYECLKCHCNYYYLC